MNNSNQISVLHVASFTGNVGDNANHNGTRTTLEENTSYKYQYTENEIRKYYQNYNKADELHFDDEFVRQANEHDLVMIGSGNFFELWIEDSKTGTTIDIETDRIEEIKSPIVFYGLGCDPYKGIPGNNAEKFQNFLDCILEQDHCLVSVRNDGSINHIKEHFGQEYASQVHKVPDGGFFTEVDDNYHPELDGSGPLIAVNVAKDMADLRFPNARTEQHSYTSFTSEFADTLDQILSSYPESKIVFIPHIYRDLEAISDVLNNMETMNQRSRVTAAPYLNGEGSERYIFDTYNKCDLAFGMRFHTNVCSIGQITPSLGLVSYPKVGDLYKELDLVERTIDLKQKGFKYELLDKVEQTFDNSPNITTEYKEINENLRISVKDFHKKIETVVTKN